ncbi:unnamed protein product [Camellia sinensis]
MDHKVLQSKIQNNHKPNNSPVWDCGSSLNDTFELKSIEREFHSAISSRTLSISRLFDHHHFRRRNNHHNPSPKNPQNFLVRFTNFFDPFLAPNKTEPVLTKKARSRKALKQTNPSSNKANIFASVISQPSSTLIASPLEDFVGKENHESLSQPQSAKKTKKVGTKAKQQQQNQSFEKELQGMQEKLQQLRIKKEQTEELKDEGGGA